MGNTAGKLSEKATRNPPGRTPEISYGHAILQPAIYNLSTVARRDPEKQPEASGNIFGKLHGENRREAVAGNPQDPPGKPPEISYGRAILQPAIYNLSTDARRGTEKQPETSGNIPRGLHGENHREADRQIHPKPAGDHREDAGKTFGNTAGKTLLRVASRPCEGKACAHIPICQRTSLSISSIHLSASHHTPPKHPVTPLVGLGRVNPAPTACGTAAPPAHGVGVRLHGAKAPRLPKRRRRQAPARGLAAVNSHHHPIRNEKKHPSPLLMGLGCVNTAPTALAGRTVAPLLMGLGRVNPAPTAGGTAAPLLTGWVCVCIEPKHPVPKPPQAAGPCSWARRRLPAPPPQPDRNAATPPHS